MTEIPTDPPGIPGAPGSGPGTLSGPPAGGGGPGAPDEILVAFAEPAEQRRLTVLVRIILAIPHLVVLYILGIASEVVALVCWFAALFTGRLPGGLADFQVGYLRWLTRFSAYLLLLTDVYPPFEFAEAQYPVRIQAEPGPLNRLAVFFRIILVIPAAIVAGLLGYGLSFLVMFVTWLIVLIAGRMPRPLHEALAATVRYHVRVTGYFLMLTARYPGGLYGDPATSAFAAAPAGGGFPAGPAGAAGPADPPAPGWGEPAPGQPGYGELGYGAPAGGAFDYGTPAAPGHPAPDSAGEPGYGQPPPGYGQAAPGQPAGYGQATPGYGEPAGYGQPAAPVRWLGGDQPWQLVLSQAAKRLVTLFLVLGVILTVGYVVLISVVAATSGNNSVTRAEATISVESSFATLSSTLSTFDSKVSACQGKLSCVNKADAQMARAFGTFAQQMGGKSMPDAASTAAAGRVRSDASQASSAFARLAVVTSPAQYQQVVASTGLESLLGRFDDDYRALGGTLGAR
jgi:hypothetical protein